MQNRYTDERNVQILVSLLKQHGIKRVIASPGTTNITLSSVFRATRSLKCFHPLTNDLLLIWPAVWPRRPESPLFFHARELPLLVITCPV